MATHRSALTLTLLLLSYTASAHDIGDEKDPHLRFAFNATALEASLVEPLTLISVCEELASPLPPEVSQRFDQWRNDNHQLLSSIDRWSNRSDEIIAKSSSITPDQVKASKTKSREALTGQIRSAFASISASEVNRRCRKLSEIVTDISVKNDSDLREHFGAVKDLEAQAFRDAP